MKFVSRTFLAIVCALGTGAGMCGSSPQRQEDAAPAPSKDDCPFDVHGHPDCNPR